MPRITYQQADGSQTTFDAAVGDSVMQVAVNHGVPGITAECGGSAACATCKVDVDPSWAARLPPADENERSLIDGEGPNVRLSCQLKLTDALDGLVVHVPGSQYR
jgi:2Fe-2S ferredoxin